MELIFDNVYGQTPLDKDEIQGLIPKHITSHKELNEWENANILVAHRWVWAKTHRNILSISFVLKLHKKMFAETWAWAGKIRSSEKNIGVAPFQIQTSLDALFKDMDYWLICSR